MNNYLVKLSIWVVVVGAIFAFLWWRGYLLQISKYVQDTREELRKCTWPTWDELKGSTVVVTLSIVLLGGFIVLTDLMYFNILRWIAKV